MRVKSANIMNMKSGKQYIKIVFPFDFNTVAKIKEFSNYSYNKENKYWKIPLSLNNALSIQKLGFVIQDPLKFWCWQERERIIASQNVDIIPGLKGKPYFYQATGVTFIDIRNGKALIADEMGLGKTIQALAWLQLHPEIRPAVLIAPSTLKLNWAREAHNWMTRPKIQILYGQSPSSITGELVIVNSDILQYWADEIVAIKPKAIIIDEVHYFKDTKTIRSEALKYISKGVKCRIGLSGTPMMNRPIELYYIWNWIDSSTVPSWPTYIRKFCNAKNNGFGLDVSGASNLDELYQLLTESIMIRRLKKDVLPELPPKTYSVIPLDIYNQKEYDRAEQDFCTYYLDGVLSDLNKLSEDVKTFAKKAGKNNDFGQLDLFDGVSGEKLKEITNYTLDKVLSAEALMKINALRQLSAEGKMPDFIAWVKDFLVSGEKLVIFCEHRDIMDQILKAFPKITVHVNGSVTGVNRQHAVDAFQNNPKIKLFVGNKAAQEGLTLTAASNVCHIEFPWNPAAIDQRNDRCHRIGQEDAVTCYYFIAQGTIDEKIAELIDLKRKITDQSLDNRKTDEVNILKNLLKQLKTKQK